jgi:hypothetical protein
MATTCPACGNEVPPGMPTCGWCGAALTAADGEATVGVHEPERRVFGIPPATGLLVLGVAISAVAFYLLLTGRVVVGAIALIVGLFVLAGFPGVARRPDESPMARRAVRSYDGIRERADATIESLAARAAARRRLAQIDGEVEQLESSRAEAIGRLGEAAYAHDEEETERLRGEIAGADAALEAKRREREQVQAETEERVEGAKLRAQPTERLVREEQEQPEQPEQAEQAERG